MRVSHRPGKKTSSSSAVVSMQPSPPQSPPRTPSEGAWWALMDGGGSPRGEEPDPSCVGFWQFILDDNFDQREIDDDESEDGRQSVSGMDEPNDRQQQGDFHDLFRCGGNLANVDQRVSDSPCAILSDVRDFAFAHEDPEFDDLYEISSSDDSGILKGNAWVARGDNVFEELQEEISFLRGRTDAIKNSSSKYKSLVTRKELARMATIKAKEESSAGLAKPTSSRRVAFLDDAPKLQRSILRKPNKALRFDSTEELIPSPPPPPPPPSPPEAESLKPQVELVRATNPLRIEARTPPPAAVSSIEPVAKLQFYQARSTDEEEDKEIPPPVRIVDPFTNDCAGAPAEDELLHGLSTLTQDMSFAWERNTAQRQNFAKSAMPPKIMKKLQSLKNLKMLRKPSMSSNGSIVSGPSFAQSCINTVMTGGPNFSYETNPKVNSYVAYFRRGGTASETVRVYEHVTPSVFPIADHEMVVKIEASTVSTTDCQVRKWEFWGEGSDNALNLPIIPGVAFVGTIIQVPKSGFRSGTGLHVGDRVTSLVPAGANARHICASADRLVKVPDTIQNPAVTACLPEIYLSAFQALHLGQRNGPRYRRSSLSGKCVLILGGATALGRALIEIALAGGCEAVYATGKDKQFDTISSIGGAPLGRDPKQWCSILGGRIDSILGIDDTIGQSELQQEHMSLLKPSEGRIVLFCAPEQDEMSVINLDDQTCATASTSGRKVFQYNVFEAWSEDMKQAKRDLAHILKLQTQGHVKPKVLERIPLNRVAKAQDLMEGKKLNGFILCEPWIRGRAKEPRNEIKIEPTVVASSDTRETIENIPETPVKSPLANVVGQLSPLALFGDTGFWKTVTENRWVSGSSADPNQTPTAANLKRREGLDGKTHLQSMIQN